MSGSADDKSALRCLPGIGRRLFGLVAVLLALAVLLGRLLLAQVETQAAWLEARLSEALGLPVQLAAISTDWQGHKPRLTLHDLTIRIASAGLEHEVSELAFELDPFASLWARQWRLSAVRGSGLDLTVEHEGGGAWRLVGIEAGEGALRRQVLDMLLAMDSLALRDVDLSLRRAGEPALRLRQAELQLRKRGDRRELWLSALPPDSTSPITAALRLRGDPRTTFDALGYLEFEGGELASLPALLLPQAQALTTLQAQGRLWLRADQVGLRSLQAKWREASAGWQLADQSLRIDQAEGGLALRRAPDGWELWLDEQDFDWQRQAGHIPELFFQLSGADEGRQLSLLTAELDLAPAVNLLRASGLLPARAEQVLAELNPRGRLQDLRLDLPLSADRALPTDFQLRARLVAGAVDAWRHAPAGSNIQGLIEARAGSGRVAVDAPGLSLHLPRLFPEAWHYEEAKGLVRWRVDESGVHVRGLPLSVRNEEVEGEVGFSLHSRQGGDGRWTSDFTLLVGVEEMALSAKTRYLPRLQQQPALMDTFAWLENALNAGELVDSGLLLRASPLGRGRAHALTVQGFFNYHDLAFNYLPDWPAIDGGQGRVVLRDREVDVSLKAGRIAGIPLAPTQARLRRNGEGSGFWLDVDGGARGDASHALAFLRQSPLPTDIMANWQASGPLTLDLSLRLPLGQAQRQPDVALRLLSEAGLLRLPALDLDFNQVRGELHYSSAEGYRAKGLQGSLFGQPLNLSISSATGPGGGLEVRGRGRVSREALQQWEPQPALVRRLLDQAEGEFDFRAALTLPARGRGHAELLLESELQGLAINLPAPFYKAAAESRPLSMRLAFGAREHSLTLRFDELLFGNLFLADGGVDRGLFYFGPRNRDFAVRQSDSGQPGLLLSGELSQLDLDAWRRALAAFPLPARQDSLDERLRLVDIDIDKLRLFGGSLEAVNLQLSPDARGWRVFLENPLLRGAVHVPQNTELPYVVDLDRLHLPAVTAGQGQPSRDFLGAIAPGSLPPLDFTARSVRVGERELGAWSFRATPKDWGLHIDELRASLGQASLGGAETGSGAVLDWRLENGEHRSHFQGTFRAGDLARVLPALGIPANVEGRSAELPASLSWPGSPAAFSLARANGDLSLRIGNGRFMDIDSGGTRFLGALSLDTVVRRLQLDFSDLYQKGLAFDSIAGNFNLGEGVLSTEGELRLQGPSGRIAIDGEVDLARRTIAADMLVTPPLGQNLTVIAGILGAWPIAVSTYVASRLFEDQVNELSSLVYRLEGPWEDPHTRFEVPVADDAALDAASPASP